MTRTRLPPSSRRSGSSSPTLTSSAAVVSAPSTDTGSVKALSISWTRLRGPATCTSAGSLVISATSNPGAGRPITRGRTGIVFRIVRSRFRVRSDGVILTTRKPWGAWIWSGASCTIRSPSCAPTRSMVARMLPASRLLMRPGEARTRTSTVFTASPVSSRSRGTFRSSTGTASPRSAVCLPAITNQRPTARARLASRRAVSPLRSFTAGPRSAPGPPPRRRGRPPRGRARRGGPA